MAEPKEVQEVLKPVRRRRDPAVPRGEGIQGFQAGMPTCGNDLVGLWELPHEAVTQARLKIARQLPMTQRWELVRDCTVQEYAMESVAYSFGPGEYRLVLNPGPVGAWGGKTALINISKEYARECGFDPMPIDPAPRPSLAHLRSLHEVGRAVQQQQPMDMGMVAQLIETSMERLVSRLQPPPQANSMEQFLAMMTFAQNLQGNAVETALKLAGIKSPVEPEPKEDSWTDVVRELIPVGTELLKGVMSSRAPQPAGQEAPRIINPEPQQQGAAVTINATEQELTPFAGAIAMLRPFSGILATKLSRVTSGADAAEELSSYIPDALVDSVIRFGELVSERGASLMSVISPELANEKGVDCIVAISRLLKAEMESEQ